MAQVTGLEQPLLPIEAWLAILELVPLWVLGPHRM